MCKMQETLALYLKARYSIIWIRSAEERRVQTTVQAIANAMNRGLWLWSITSGFTTPTGSGSEPVMDPQQALMTIREKTTSDIFILWDFHPYVAGDNPVNAPVIRGMRELAHDLKASSAASCRSVICVSPEITLPIELQSEVVVLDWPLPDEEVLTRAVADIVSALEPAVQNRISEDRSPIVQAARGLTLAEAEDCFARSVVSVGTLDPAIISGEKKRIVERSGALEWRDPPADGMDGIGGLDLLKAWAVERQLGFSPAAREYGLDVPKGVLLVGPPGTGKTVGALAIGASWGLPVLVAAAERMSGGLVGESEAKVRKMLNTAEAVAPCLVLLDEIEKLLAGAGGDGAADSGVGKKTFGMILSWMSDKTAPVFVVASSNGVEGLPPELLRRGRFDQIFFVDLPTLLERRAIFSVHLGRRRRDPAAFDLDALSRVTEGFSGAEVEAVVVDGMFQAFAGGTEVTTAHLIEAAGATVPLSKVSGERIEAVRKWAKGRARPASLPETKVDGSRFSNLA